jgi:hypothetical protein
VIHVAKNIFLTVHEFIWYFLINLALWAKLFRNLAPVFGGTEDGGEVVQVGLWIPAPKQGRLQWAWR